MEKDIDYLGMDIKDLISLKLIEKRFGVRVLEGDVGFKRVSQDWYCREKSKILLKMNFNGGFRGILNSNIGNDIHYNKTLFTCDFDTFKIIKIPKNPDYKFIKNFVLWCFVELLKTSPTCWDYLDLGKFKPKNLEILTESYRKNSLLWKYYYKGFIQEAKKRKWNLLYVEEAIKEMIKAPVYYDMILDVVPNNILIKNSYSPENSFYFPQS